MNATAHSPLPLRLPRVPRWFLVPLLLVLAAPSGLVLWHLKWVADHPSVSAMDKDFQAALAGASFVRISGAGKCWDESVSGEASIGFSIKDRVALQELAATLRCEDEKLKPTPYLPTHEGVIVIEVQSAPIAPLKLSPAALKRPAPLVPQSFVYRREAGSSSLESGSLGRGTIYGEAPVRRRFAPCFEALIGQLGERATAPGSHPGFILLVKP